MHNHKEVSEWAFVYTTATFREKNAGHVMCSINTQHLRQLLFVDVIDCSAFIHKHCNFILAYSKLDLIVDKIDSTARSIVCNVIKIMNGFLICFSVKTQNCF